MKTVAAVLALACLAQCALAAVQPGGCKDFPTTSCEAVAALQISVSRGKCKAEARADCKTWSQSESTFQETFKEWWSEGDKICDGDKVEAAARAVAVAIAKVWTSAAVQVSCDEKSQGFSCGWAFGNGATFGKSVAEALATAAADASLALEEEGASGAETADAFCFADVRAIGAAFTTAASKATTDACVRDGRDPVSTYESSFVESIQKVVADAFASASARVCKVDEGEGKSDVTAESECRGTGEVSEAGTFVGDGDFCFVANNSPACKGPGADVCCSKKRGKVCSISRKVCKNCNGPWTLVGSRVEGSPVFYMDRKGNECFCDEF